MVGLGCNCSHSHIFKTSLLCHSQVEGESFALFPNAIHQVLSTLSQKEAFIQENPTFPFQEAPSKSQFTVFAGGSQLPHNLEAAALAVLIMKFGVLCLGCGVTMFLKEMYIYLSTYCVCLSFSIKTSL